ncbi:MAG: Na+/H+ antiporter [Acidobacteriaceae bacterium]|nr:Na+/H+ antiporter [Acidobacteriaceae bacterium]
MNGAESLHGVQTVFLLLMVFVAAFAVVARRLQVPYPIVLVIAGLGISVVPGLPRITLNPEVVFLVILPPLLFSSAWAMSLREFKFNLVSIGMLAVGLVGFTVWAVAMFADHFIPGLGWQAGFVLGAVVSPTDAIAATSIARTLGLPRRITDLLEGESLVNDATGLLALEFGVMMLVDGHTPTIGAGLLRLLWLILGGTGVGLLIGVIGAWFERWIDDGPIEIVISLVAPYAAYLAGESAKASGVLAVVACGLYMSRKSAVYFSAETRIQVNAVWDALTFVMNGIVFVLIGLQLPYVIAGIRGYGVKGLLIYGSVFSVVLILLRLLWMFPSSEVAYQIRTKLLKQDYKRGGPRGVFVVGWTGMRGVVALAAAISLPNMLGNGHPFAEKNLIVFLTFSVILVTLVVQGLSLPPLIRALGLAGDEAVRVEEEEARRLVLKEVIQFLQEGWEKEGEDSAHAYEDLLHQYGHRMEALIEDAAEGDHSGHHHGGASLLALTKKAVEVERQTMLRLRDEGRISDEVLRMLEYELDLTESRANSRAPGVSAG